MTSYDPQHFAVIDSPRCTKLPKISKIPKFGRPRNIKIPRPIQTYPKLSNKYERRFNKMLDLQRLIYISRSSEMFQDLRDFIEIPPCRRSVFFRCKMSVNISCRWNRQKIVSGNVGTHKSKLFKMSDPLIYNKNSF